jgi:hypothetical protein
MNNGRFRGVGENNRLVRVVTCARWYTVRVALEPALKGYLFIASVLIGCNGDELYNSRYWRRKKITNKIKKHKNKSHKILS